MTPRQPGAMETGSFKCKIMETSLLLFLVDPALLTVWLTERWLELHCPQSSQRRQRSQQPRAFQTGKHHPRHILVNLKLQHLWVALSTIFTATKTQQSCAFRTRREREREDAGARRPPATPLNTDGNILSFYLNRDLQYWWRGNELHCPQSLQNTQDNPPPRPAPRPARELWM